MAPGSVDALQVDGGLTLRDGRARVLYSLAAEVEAQLRGGMGMTTVAWLTSPELALACRSGFAPGDRAGIIQALAMRAEELRPLDVVFFPRGPEGAHQVRNDADEPAHVLLWSTVVLPTATVYPDSDKIGIWTGNPDDNVLVERSSGVDYYHGET